MNINEMVAAEMEAYSEGAYADHGSARDMLTKFAHAVADAKHKACEAQVASLIKDIRDADDLLSKGDNSGALVQVRIAASRASKSYLDCVGRAATPRAL